MSIRDKMRAVFVKEIKEIEPLADVYKLDKFKRYIVYVTPSKIMPEVTKARASQLTKALEALDIKAIVLTLDKDDRPVFYELNPD